MVGPQSIHEWIEHTYDYRESQIKLCLQPKPRWLPTKLYHAILKRLLFIQQGQFDF